MLKNDINYLNPSSIQRFASLYFVVLNVFSGNVSPVTWTKMVTGNYLYEFINGGVDQETKRIGDIHLSTIKGSDHIESLNRSNQFHFAIF